MMKNEGRVKLIGGIRAASKLRYQYIWVGTCYIDKRNNSELAEAITSMGDWYQNAAICLVYLDDFKETNITEETTSNT
jgi:hypothetical protein